MIAQWIATEDCKDLRREGHPRDRSSTGCPAAGIAVTDHAHGRFSDHPISNRSTETTAFHQSLRRTMRFSSRARRSRLLFAALDFGTYAKPNVRPFRRGPLLAVAWNGGFGAKPIAQKLRTLMPS